MNKNLIIGILIVIIIAILLFVFVHPQTTTPDGKINTQISFLSKDTLKNGEMVEFELKDANGKAIAAQHVNITYVANGQSEAYSIITDNNGKGYLSIDGESAGKYEITVSYNGSDKYNGCSAKLNLTIEEGSSTQTANNTPQNSTTSTLKYNNGTSSSSGSSQVFYDAELNVYFDKNGKVIGGQSAGSNIWDLRNNPQMVVDGSLV